MFDCLVYIFWMWYVYEYCITIFGISKNDVCLKSYQKQSGMNDSILLYIWRPVICVTPRMYFDSWTIELAHHWLRGLALERYKIVCLSLHWCNINHLDNKLIETSLPFSSIWMMPLTPSMLSIPLIALLNVVLQSEPVPYWIRNWSFNSWPLRTDEMTLKMNSRLMDYWIILFNHLLDSFVSWFVVFWVWIVVIFPKNVSVGILM